jgi:glucose-6-phosphate isomerase
VGALIALFERAVGFYATLINVNAYDQPGVDAGKKTAAEVMVLQRRVLSYFREKPGQFLTSSQIASGIGAHGDFETVFRICEHLAANQRGISIKVAKSPFEAAFCWS